MDLVAVVEFDKCFVVEHVNEGASDRYKLKIKNNVFYFLQHSIELIYHCFDACDSDCDDVQVFEFPFPFDAFECDDVVLVELPT